MCQSPVAVADEIAREDRSTAPRRPPVSSGFAPRAPRSHLLTTALVCATASRESEGQPNARNWAIAQVRAGTPTSCGRLLLPALVLAAERIAASDPPRPAVRAIRGRGLRAPVSRQRRADARALH